MSERPISRGRSLAPVRVWIDDPNPVFRHGLARYLEANGYEIAGLGCGLVPEPPPGSADVLIFDLGGPAFGWDVGAGRPVPERLLGIAVAGTDSGFEMATLDSVVVRSEVTPEAILSALSVALGRQTIT